MRTNIVLDKRLISEAMRCSGIKTKRELVDTALREFVTQRKRLDVRDLRGGDLMDPAYDYKQARSGK